MLSKIRDLRAAAYGRFAHYDKVEHFVVGALIRLVVGFGHPTLGLAAAAAAAWYKEERDRKQPTLHTKDGWDAFATLLGAVFVDVIDFVLTFALGVRIPRYL